MNQYRIFAIANLVFGVTLVILSKLILPVCHGGTMRCGTSATMDAILGLVLVVIASMAAVLPRKKVHVVLSALSFVVSVFVSLVPTVIVGVCPNAQMACHRIMGPVFAVMGVVIALFVTVNFSFLIFRGRNGQNKS